MYVQWHFIQSLMINEVVDFGWQYFVWVARCVELRKFISFFNCSIVMQGVTDFIYDTRQFKKFQFLDYLLHELQDPHSNFIVNDLTGGLGGLYMQLAWNLYICLFINEKNL